jgi:hypothetical protein
VNTRDNLALRRFEDGLTCLIGVVLDSGEAA